MCDENDGNVDRSPPCDTCMCMAYPDCQTACDNLWYFQQQVHIEGVK